MMAGRPSKCPPQSDVVRCTLCAAIKASGLQRQQVAKRAGMVPGHLTQVLNGVGSGGGRSLRWETIERVAAAAGFRAVLVLYPVEAEKR